MNKYKLIGLKPPGRVNLPRLGTIDLEKIDDTLAEKLFMEGIPFIAPLPKPRDSKKMPLRKTKGLAEYLPEEPSI